MAYSQPADWSDFQALLGDWAGEGRGGPGQGSGAFSFQPDLDGKVLIRKNHAEYPAMKDHPAAVHDDLMIMYRDQPDAQPHAIYFDNEGHVIRYDVATPAPGGPIVFLSAPQKGAPQYRLTYTPVEGGRLKIKFEIAPPGERRQFAMYIDAAPHRVSNSRAP